LRQRTEAALLPRRRSLAQENGAAICAAFCQFDEVRRFELGVEAMCQLIIDAVSRRAKNRDAAAPASQVRRYWEINNAVVGQPLPDLTRTVKVTAGMLVWMCLKCASGWMKNLVRVHSKGRWQEVQEMIVAWQDAWGSDGRAKYAQARFATLTGIVREPDERHDAYMHAALVKALSDVQA
jgi:hypothetical protein